MEVKVNADKCRIKDLNFGDIFVVNSAKFPYILTDNDPIYCKTNDGEWVCVALETGGTISFDGNAEVIVVKDVELNYDL